MLSLEKLCLNSIVENFKQLYFEFIVSKKMAIPNDNLEKNFEFLRRRFTQELVAALFKSGKLEEEFLKFLINEHLIFLDGAWLKNSRYLQLNTLKEIFRRTPKLKRIRFYECGDEILENIAKCCSEIVEIDMNFSIVTDAGIICLCKKENGMLPFPELKNIFLKHSHITDYGAEYLIRSLPQLERFEYSYIPRVLYRIHSSEKKNIHCYNLVHLNVMDCSIRYKILAYKMEMLEACFTLCPKLKSLNYCVSNEEELKLLAKSHLKKIRFQYTDDISVNAINNFLKLAGCNLSSISFSNCTIHVPSLANYCPVLSEFSASDVTLTDSGEQKLILPSLTKCNFDNPRSDSCANSLALLISSSPKLEYISLTRLSSGLQFKTPILSWCKTPTAKKIQFGCLTVLEIDFIKEIILSSPSLEEMYLFACGIPEPEMEVLKDIAKRLPNKPEIGFAYNPSAGFGFMISFD